MTNCVRHGVLAACCLAAALVLLGSGPAAAQKGGKLTFEIYKDRASEYRWRLTGADGKVLAVPEDAYKNLTGARDAVENIKKNADSKKWKVEVYADKDKEQRWRLKAANGAVMARSTRGYASKAAAEKAAALFRQGAKKAKVVEKK